MPVLATKLRAPARRRELVPRDRLVDRLAAAMGRPPRLVLVSAPAGFGKTTLLTQWLTSPALAGATVAWLAVDAADGDVRRFLTALVAAIQVAAPDVGGPAGIRLAAGDLASSPDVLVDLINELDLVAGTTVIALDDYHLVDDAEVHEAVIFLLENLPPRVTLAVSTRADPPLPLARLRARAELVEIRGADLRFTPTEAEAFLNGVMGLGLTPEQVGVLGARTEGWATGLQLAALSVPTGRLPAGSTARPVRPVPASAAGRPGGTGDAVAAFVDTFAGSQRFVLDYLVEEVLDRQPPAIREFLLSTSVLDQLTADLCDALTGRTDGAVTLDALDRGNLFLVTLDGESGWYRYHHLFGEALRARLRATGPARVGALHRVAARWYADAGRLTEAVPHALAAPDPELAADLLELALPELRRLRYDRTLRDWLAALPDAGKRDRPMLAAAQAWSRLAVGRPDEVAAWLDAADAALGPDVPPLSAPAAGPGLDRWRPARAAEWRALPAMIAVYRGAVAQARGDVAGTVAQAERALALAGPDDHGSRGAAAGFLGLAAWADGDLVTAVATFTRAVDHLRAAGKTTDVLGATVVLAQMVLAQGRPDEARRLYEQALAVADRPDGPAPSVTGDLHIGLADLLREGNRLTAAQRRLDRASDLGSRSSLPENRFRADVTAAGVRRALGDLDGAADLLDRAAARFRPGYFPDVRPIAAARARLDIVRGRLDAARAWARVHAPPADEPPRYLTEDARLTLARLLIAEGRAPDAVALLGPLLAAATAADRPGSVLEIRLIRAVAHDAAGDAEAAADDLAGALTIGVPAGYRRLFLDEGEPVLRLLRRAAGSAAAPGRGHATTVLAAAREVEQQRAPGGPSGRSGPAPDPSPAPSSGGPEELSPRELEVLRLLATELTGPEIARTLFISVNTLRTHTKRIFAKLGARTRRAAVARAVDRGLLVRSGADGNHPTDHIMR